MAYLVEPPLYPENVSVGRHTYGLSEQNFFGPTADAPITVGNFCSFAAEVLIFAMSEHRQGVSTYQFSSYGFGSTCRQILDGHAKGATIIGSDVWVGRRASILSGVKVGNGAIIGAGAVVAKDVPAYAVVVGNPARAIKFRFDKSTIEDLEDIAWWNWSDDKINEWQEYFYGPIESFIKRAKDSNRVFTKSSDTLVRSSIRKFGSIFGV